MTLNTGTTYLDNNFINSSKSSKNYHSYAAYADCEDHAPTITIDPTGSSIYVSRTNIPFFGRGWVIIP